jgi:rubredoxin
MAKANDMYLCQVHNCGYVYDPDRGDPKRNIAPGTAFADLPDSWKCPICGAHKHMFKPLAGPGSVFFENLRKYGGMSSLSDQEIEERINTGQAEVASPTAQSYQQAQGAPADVNISKDVDHQAKEPK